VQNLASTFNPNRLWRAVVQKMCNIMINFIHHQQW